MVPSIFIQNFFSSEARINLLGYAKVIQQINIYLSIRITWIKTNFITLSILKVAFVCMEWAKLGIDLKVLGIFFEWSGWKKGRI